jgi:hypothetical protein
MQQKVDHANHERMPILLEGMREQRMPLWHTVCRKRASVALGGGR